MLYIGYHLSSVNGFEAMGREQHRRNERRTRRDAERGFKGRGKKNEEPAGNYDKFMKKSRRKK